MMMERSLVSFVLCLMVGIAVATTESNGGAQENAPAVRVRRGLINVKQQADELQRLSTEFGEGGLRDLREEDMEAMLGEDLSFSYMSMSMSFSYAPSKKGKNKGGHH